jgi:hypothetical protein
MAPGSVPVMHMLLGANESQQDATYIEADLILIASSCLEICQHLPIL